MGNRENTIRTVLSRISLGTAVRKIELKIDLYDLFGYMFVGMILIFLLACMCLVSLTWIPVGQ